MPNTTNTLVRLTAKDRELLQLIQEKLDLDSMSSTMRRLVRDKAKELGLEISKSKEVKED